MIVAIAIVCALCEAVFTAMEVALGALSRARLRALAEDEEESRADHTPVASPGASAGASPAASTSSSAPPSTSGTAGGARYVRRGARVASRPERLLALMEHPDRLSLGFITITSLSLWTASALLTWQAMRDGWSVWSLVGALLGVLFFAEALPLVIAARNPEAIALAGVGLVEKSLRVLSPLSLILGGVGAGVARLFGVRSGARPQVTEGDLRHALDQAEHEGVIEPEERAMLEGAIDFRGKQVREVMTPRIDIVGVPEVMPLRAVLDVAMQQGHSRLPVYERTVDTIVGVIATKDLLPHLRPRSTSGEPSQVLVARDVMRPAFYLPQSKRIDAAIDDLRRQRMLMAIVVEPDGGTAGIVTLEDLLEEIVGEIEDEYDEAEAPLRLLLPEPETGESTGESTGAEDVVVAQAVGQAAPLGIIADASCSVRQAEKFWRRHLGDSLVLFERARVAPPTLPESAAGASVAPASVSSGVAPESLSLAALAQQLFDGVPCEGDRAPAGVVSPSGVARDEATLEAATALVEMEVTKAIGPRLEEVRLVRVVPTEASGL